MFCVDYSVADVRTNELGDIFIGKMKIAKLINDTVEFLFPMNENKNILKLTSYYNLEQPKEVARYILDCFKYLKDCNVIK